MTVVNINQKITIFSHRCYLRRFALSKRTVLTVDNDDKSITRLSKRTVLLRLIPRFRKTTNFTTFRRIFFTFPFVFRYVPCVFSRKSCVYGFFVVSVRSQRYRVRSSGVSPDVFSRSYYFYSSVSLFSRPIYR